MNKKTEAKCNGMMLTVGFHGAKPPLIWRFDLERNHSFTMALQGEEGDWELGVTTLKGDFHAVAHFLAREDAEEALMKIEKILTRKRGIIGAVLKALSIVALLAIIIIGGVFVFAAIISHRASPVAANVPAPAQIQEGVPQAADDVLKAPPP